MTEAEVYELADLFIQKHRLTNVRWDGRWIWGYDTDAEAFRQVIANIIVDTEMVVDGSVPLERWREPVSP